MSPCIFVHYSLYVLNYVSRATTFSYLGEAVANMTFMTESCYLIVESGRRAFASGWERCINLAAERSSDEISFPLFTV